MAKGVPCEHHKKKGERENLSRLLKHMKEKGSISFTEAKNLLNVSKVTVSSYFKQLIDDKKIEHYFTSEEGQRREQARYKLKKESLEIVDAEIGQYESTKFIGDMLTEKQKPVYSYRTTQDGSKSVSVFMTQPDDSMRKVAQNLADMCAGYYLKGIDSRFIRAGKGQRHAIVLMIKHKDEGKSE